MRGCSPATPSLHTRPARGKPTRTPADILVPIHILGKTRPTPLPTPPIPGPPAPAEPSPYSRHVPALDGIRGLAILGVAGSHLFFGTPTSALMRYAVNVLAFGANGVYLFFVLSGFLITGILYDTLGEPRFFRKFYARRTLRIFPLYYAVIAAYALAALLLRINFRGELLALALYTQNTYLVATPIYIYQGPPLPLGHFWSLAIEEQFYLLWPVVVFLIRRRERLLRLCLAFILLCPLLRFSLLRHGSSYNFVYNNTLCNADLLLAGAALALLLRGPAHDRILRAAPWVFVAGLALAPVISTFTAHTGLATHPPLLMSLGTALAVSGTAFASAALIALAFRPGIVRRIFSLQPLRFLGKYSYGMYVFHVIVFHYLQQPVRDAVAHIAHSKALGVVAAGLTTFALTVLAAFVSYNLYERRFLRLKRFFDYRPHPNTAGEQTQAASRQ